MPNNKLKEALQSSINWLMAETKYFKVVREDFNKLKEFLSKSMKQESLKGIKYIFRDLKYVGKAEKRFNHYESEVEKLSLEFYKQIATEEIVQHKEEIEDLKERMHVEAVQLLTDFSFYDGRIKSLLEHLQSALKKREIEQVQACLIEIDQVLNDGEEWIAAAQADLKKAKELAEEFQEVYNHGLEGIKNAMVHMSNMQKLVYIKSISESFQKNKKSFPRVALEELMEIAARAAADEDSEEGYKELSSFLIYSENRNKWGEYFFRLKRYWNAVSMFEISRNYNRAADAYVKLEHYGSALDYYKLAGNKKEVRRVSLLKTDHDLDALKSDMGRIWDWKFQFPEKFNNVANSYKELGAIKKAVEVYEFAAHVQMWQNFYNYRDGYWPEEKRNLVIKYLKSAGYMGFNLYHKIAELCSKNVFKGRAGGMHGTNMHIVIAQFYEEGGYLETALSYYKEAPDFNQGREIRRLEEEIAKGTEEIDLKEKKEMEKKAEEHEVADEWKKAADLWGKVGNNKRAVKAAKNISSKLSKMNESKEKKKKRNLRKLLRKNYTS